MTAATLIDPETSSPIELMRWTREQFEAAAAKGAFDDDPRIELLDGHILSVPVQSPRHVTAIQKAAALLTPLFQPSFHVRTQAPFSLDGISSPEPNVAVVPGPVEEYASEHPARTVLLVEVSDATLAKDRGPKLRAYARNGVPEYWIVNLPDAQIEVHREPRGETYASRQVFRAGQSIAALDRPDAVIAVADLLP